jgi:hypothetical protein
LDHSLDKHAIRRELQLSLGGHAGPTILGGWSLLRVCRLALDTVLRDEHVCPSYADEQRLDEGGVECAVCDAKAERLRAIVHPASDTGDDLEAEPEPA